MDIRERDNEMFLNRVKKLYIIFCIGVVMIAIAVVYLFGLNIRGI